MQNTLYILIAIAIIGFLLFFMPIQIKLKIIKKNEDDLILVRYKSLYGILNLKFEFEMFDIVFVNGRPSLKYKAKIESNKTNRLIKRFKKIFTSKDFKNISKYFRGDKILIKRITEYLIKHLVFRNLSVIIKLGFIDAFFTSVLCGAAWTILGTVLAIIKNNLNLTLKNIIVAPILEKESFEMEIGCIINFRLGDIINIGILVLKRRRELKKIKLSHEKILNC